MTLQHIKVMTIVAWVLAIGAAGLLAGVTSSSGWFALAALAIVPPLVAMRFWKRPDQTMSQSIQEALRK
jgi:Na+(H+)/acetate symporter ActP